MRISIGQLRNVIRTCLREAVYEPGPRRMTRRNKPQLGDDSDTCWDDDEWEDRTVPHNDKDWPGMGTLAPFNQ